MKLHARDKLKRLEKLLHHRREKERISQTTLALHLSGEWIKALPGPAVDFEVGSNQSVGAS
jgi:hypothetical protein